MAIAPSPDHTRLIARTELRRRWRALADSYRIVLVAISGLFVAGLALVMTGAAYAIGTAVGDAGGIGVDLVTGGEYAAAFMVVFVAVFTAFRVVQKSGRIDNQDAMLTTVPHRDVVAGLVLAEVAVLPLMVVGFVFPASVAFGVGAGIPLAVPLMVLSSLVVAILGLLVGWLAGLAAKYAILRSPLLARYRTVVGGALFLAYFGVIYSDEAASAFGPLFGAVSASPVGWFADLALVGVVPAADPLLAGAAVATALVGVPALFAGVVWLAGRVWYADRATGSHRTRGGSGLGGVPGLSRPAAAVVRKSWLRARRYPLKLAFVVYPVFLLFQPVADALRTGSVGPGLPLLLALYLAWAGGAAVTLNPLGDEGSVLPVTLTTGVDARTFVTGLCVAGVAGAMPATVAATLVAAVIGPYSLPQAVTLAAVGGVLAAAATGVAVGVGATFPRFDAVRVTGSRTAVVPSTIAFGAYSLVLVVVASPAVASFHPLVASFLPGGPATQVTVAVVALAVALAAGALGVRHGVRRVDAYEP